jgi:diguanylate cyclase (GGDEF)-like protein
VSTIFIADAIFTADQNARKRVETGRLRGGEEFLVIAKGLGLAEGEGLAEKVRRAVEQSRFTHDGEAIPLTVSAGVAVHRTGETPDQLVARADSALYAAKEAGRNTVRSTA